MKTRIAHEDGTVTEQKYHPNGVVASEVSFIDKRLHGMSRGWHPNGVLASEIPLDHGIIDGTVRQWNEKGELLGSCEIRKGTGIYRIWFPSGNLVGETTLIDGKWTGRQRAYFDGGELAGETYWLDDEKVSKKRYLEACKLNPNLPSYEVENTRRPTRSAIRDVAGPLTCTAGATDELPLKLLQGERAREVLSWLEESRQPSRSLGEATGQEDSIKLAKKLYRLGAVAIHAVDIQGEKDDDQNSGRLVVELPQDKKLRKKLLRVCGNLAREMGFDPDPDVEQHYLLLMLD